MFCFHFNAWMILHFVDVSHFIDSAIADYFVFSLVFVITDINTMNISIASSLWEYCFL